MIILLLALMVFGWRLTRTGEDAGAAVGSGEPVLMLAVETPDILLDYGYLYLNEVRNLYSSSSLRLGDVVVVAQFLGEGLSGKRMKLEVWNCGVLREIPEFTYAGQSGETLMRGDGWYLQIVNL